MLEPAATKYGDMTKTLPSLPLTAAITMALALSACGKQEAVGDVPSAEELAQQADEASAAIRDEAAQNEDGAEAAPEALTLTTYSNALRGYSIMVPESWAADEAASDDNGATFNAPENGGALTVNWTENAEDADFQAAKQAVEDAGEQMSGEDVGEDQFRASGNSDENTKSMVRVFRKADGTMVSANLTYPAESAQKLDTIAKQIMDSLALK